MANSFLALNKEFLILQQILTTGFVCDSLHQSYREESIFSAQTLENTKWFCFFVACLANIMLELMQY